MTDIVQHPVERPCSQVVDGFFYLRHAAGFDEGLAPRLGGRETRRFEPPGQFVDPVSELAVDIQPALSGASPEAQTLSEASQEGHAIQSSARAVDRRESRCAPAGNWPEARTRAGW